MYAAFAHYLQRKQSTVLACAADRSRREAGFLSLYVSLYIACFEHPVMRERSSPDGEDRAAGFGSVSS